MHFSLRRIRIFNFLKRKNIGLFLLRSEGESGDDSNKIRWSYLENGSREYGNFIRENYFMFSDFREKYLTLVHQEGDLYLYELKK